MGLSTAAVFVARMSPASKPQSKLPACCVQSHNAQLFDQKKRPFSSTKPALYIANIAPCHTDAILNCQFMNGIVKGENHFGL